MHEQCLKTAKQTDNSPSCLKRSEAHEGQNFQNKTNIQGIQ